MTVSGTKALRVERTGRAVEDYDRSAARFATLYESTTFERVHAGILDLLPALPTDVLDVGAGSGRDAAALSGLGHRVTAVEPSLGLRTEAALRHDGLGIEWLDDDLPLLAGLYDRTFGFVLLSAVWMHLPLVRQASAMRRLATLLSAGALLAVTLRTGTDAPGRDLIEASPDHVVGLASASGLSLERSAAEHDALGRPGVSWSTLAFRKS